MRYLIILIAAFCLSSTSGTLNAQVNVNVNFNLGSQPIWGPTGYDYVENYYIPEIDVYYNVPQHRYFYFEGGLWIGRTSLPVRFRAFNLFNVYKIVINEPQPWHNHKMWKGKYASYRGRHDQHFIRDSRDSKYFVVKGHPQHEKWLKEKNNKGNPNGPNMRSPGNSKQMEKNMGGMNKGGKAQRGPSMQKQGRSQGGPGMQKQGKGGGGGNKGGKGGGGGKGGK
ncbi:MAG: hypothetical protein WCR42_09635 [bacterium]